MGWSKQREWSVRLPYSRACSEYARESLESSVAAQDLGEYRDQVREAANVSIIARRTW